jgi:CubicO group peptidase (beta-lactamase class C family)
MTIQLDRRGFIAALGATTALSGCATGAPAPSGLPRVADVPPASPTSVGMSADLTANINAMMKGYIDSQDLTGGVTAVARNNKLVHFAAHGMFDREKNIPMRTDALFRMMSSTKPVTGVAVLQQREEGKLSLDDKVSKYIPELKEMKVWKPEAMQARRAGGIQAMRAPAKPEEVVPANREITLKDLATHTSGLNGTARSQNDTLAISVPKLKDVPLDFQPGEKWAYSATTGPDVLARVVEITSGIAYDKYLKTRIFDPIGMVDAGHNPSPEQRSRLTIRYGHPRTGGKAWQVAGGQDDPAPFTYFAGSYGLNATAKDYLLFETMLLNKGTIHGERVLKPESVELMSSNLIGDLYKGIRGDTKGTGFGVLVRTVLDPATCGCGRSKGGFGWGGAYGTMSWTDPEEKLVAVIMIQQPIDQAQRDFETVIRKAIIGKA